MSDSLKQAVEEIKSQEAVCNVLPDLWLRKCSPGISFINKNLPNNRIRMIKSKEELELLPDKSTDIFKKSIIDRYMDRPTCRKFASLKTFCLA